MQRNILKKLVKEELKKLSEGDWYDAGIRAIITPPRRNAQDHDDRDAMGFSKVFSNPENILSQFEKFDSIFKTHMTPILRELESLKKTIDINAKTLPSLVVVDFRNMLQKLNEIKELKNEIIEELNDPTEKL